MDGSSNSTKVNVDIGASGSYKGVVQEAMGQFDGLWKKISEGGPASMIAIAGVAGIGIAVGSAVKQAADFQSSLTRLVATAGESQQNLGLVSDGIEKVATSTGTSLQQLSDAMYVIESGGQHGANGLKVLTAAAEGAKAENADLKTVADAVTSILQDYHLKAEDSANVTSKLVAAVGAGKTNFQEMAGSLHSILPVASAAHVSMNDILGDIASMTVHGMSADQATQNLANAIRSLQSPSQSAQQYLAQLGINAVDLTDKLSKKGLSGTLQDISDAIMKKMGPSGKVLIDSFNQSKSAADDANKMIASMPKSLQALAKQFEDGKISLGDYRKEIKNLPVDQANLMQQFGSLQNRASGFNNLLKSGSPEALSYSQALQKATGNATTMNVALMLTGENAQYTNNAIRTVSQATADASGHVKGWSEVQNNLNVKLSQLGEMAQVGAVRLGTVLLPVVTNIISGIIDFMNFTSNLGTIFGQVMQTISSAVKVAEGDVSSAFKQVNGFLQQHKKGIEQIVGVLTVLFLPALVKVGVQAAVTFAKMAVDATVSAAKQVVQAGIAGVAWVVQSVKASVAWTVQFALMIVKATAASVVFAAKAAIGGYAWVLQATKASIAWLIAFPKMAVGAVGAAAKFVAQAVVAAGPWIANAIKVAIQWAISFGAMIAGSVATAAASLIAGAQVAVAWLLALGPIGLIIAGVAAIAAAAFLVITNWKSVLSFFQTIGSFVVGFFKNAGNWLYDAGKNLINGLLNGAKSILKDIGNFFLNMLPGWIKDPFKAAMGIHSPSTVFAEMGQNLGQGLIQGVEAMQPKASLAVNHLVTGSPVMSSLQSPVAAPSSSSVNNYSNANSSNTTVSIGQVVLNSDAAVREFFTHIDRDTQLHSMGLTPARGVQ